MPVRIEEMKNDPEQGIYWVRVFVANADKKGSLVYECASDNYLKGYFKKSTLEENTQAWLAAITQKWNEREKSLDAKFFEKPVQVFVYAETQEGGQNLLEFVKAKVQNDFKNAKTLKKE